MRVLSPARYDAVIFDLDGVLTRTARLHAAAWKQVFDDFLARHAPAQPAFDLQQDYRRHVDGKPRLDGVRGFLQARGIRLPEGRPGDPTDAATVHGLAARKNELFLQRLAHEGADADPAALALVRGLRRVGIRTAVVSASRNAKPVLESVGALDLFDATIDGIDAQQQGLAGKPAPDTFLAAARQLGVPPGRAVVVEDALAGVEAGRAGGFGLVVGVDRQGQAKALRAHGADAVVQSMEQLRAGAPRPPPHALRAMPRIAASLGQRRLALFLDYDGTLTPIVERPEMALMSEAMRAILQRLAPLCTLAVISGRDLADVRSRVGVAGICYAGSHGFDIDAPGLALAAPPAAAAAVPELDAAEAWLREELAPVPGAALERKRFGLAIHYRRVEPGRHDAVETAVDQALRRATRLRRTSGKMVFELLPDIPWNKGAALNALRDGLGLHGDDSRCIYIGDDVTDEDAFEVLHGDDLGIVVMDPPRPTSARLRLRDPAQVGRFLAALAGRLQGRKT